jgi:hypothetical protein
MVENMVRPSRARWLVLGLVVLAGCKSTELKSSWSPHGAQPIAFRKVIVLAIAKKDVTRRVAEDAMVRNIRSAEAVPAYRLIPDTEIRNEQKVRARITEAGFDGIVTMRLVGVKKQVTQVPGYHAPDRSSFRSYYGRSWGEAYNPGYTVVDDIVEIETNIYSVKEDRRVWAGLSETFDPSSVESLVDDLAVEIAKDLRKKGLLPPEDKSGGGP